MMRGLDLKCDVNVSVLLFTLRLFLAVVYFTASNFVWKLNTGIGSSTIISCEANLMWRFGEGSVCRGLKLISQMRYRYNDL
jgi:hypothetical protein